MLISYILVTFIIDVILWVCTKIECELKESRESLRSNKDIQVVLDDDPDKIIYSNIDFNMGKGKVLNNVTNNFNDSSPIEVFTDRVFINYRRIKNVAFSKFHHFSYLSQKIFDSFGNYPLLEFKSTQLHPMAQVHNQQWKDAAGMAKVSVRIDGYQSAREHLFVILCNPDYPVLLGIDYTETLSEPPADIRAFITGERTTCV